MYQLKDRGYESGSKHKTQQYVVYKKPTHIDQKQRKEKDIPC